MISPASDRYATLPLPDGLRLAYYRTPAANPEDPRPGVVFCGGFMSDMSGSKATALEAFCQEEGLAYVRFDYFGHGASDGAFIDGTLSRWKSDVLAVLEHLTTGPQVLIGSSLGGWLVLLAARERPERIAGLIGIASAPDFTEDLIWGAMDAGAQATLLAEGRYDFVSEYSDEPYPISRHLVEDGRRHLLLGEDAPPLSIHCPVRLIHGMADDDVPCRYSLALPPRLATDDVRVTLVKNGDHRMSSPEDIILLQRTLSELVNGKL